MLGADVLEPEPLASSAKSEGFVAGSIVGHHPLHFDTEGVVVGHGLLEECDCALLLFARHHLGESDPGVIVDGDVNELPADAPIVALSDAIARDAVADPVEASELFDVDVDHLARVIAFIPAHRLSRLQRREPVEAQASQDAAHCSGGNIQFIRDLLAGAALPTQNLYGGACGR
jgi:hypothetical protein